MKLMGKPLRLNLNKVHAINPVLPLTPSLDVLDGCTLVELSSCR
jgi:hypothetical protein